MSYFQISYILYRNLSLPRFCMLIDGSDGLFTTPNCQNINICPRKTNRHQSCKRRKGQEVHLFNIFTFSYISHCQGIQTMIALSQRETGRMKDRRARLTERGRKRETAINWLQSVSDLTLNFPRGCLSAAVYTVNQAVEAALAQFPPISR